MLVTDHFPPPGARRSAVTIGNFDGCHLGHQALVRAAVASGEALGAVPTAITFLPRPEAYFQGRASEALLFTEAQKSRALSELGCERQIVQRFDADFSRISHVTFYEQYLRESLGAVALIVGDNFRFGAGRRGDPAFLAERCAADGIRFTVGEITHWAGEGISSSRIRAALCRDGDAAGAAGMLGRPYLLEGTIRRGDQLGRQLGFPTANLEEVAQLLPRFGIYAGWVWLGEPAATADVPPILARPPTAWPAAFSIGVRPTLTQSAPPVRIEAHLLAGSWAPDALYGRRAGFYLAHWLRPEARFPDLDDLRAQIAKDVAAARQLLC